MGYLEMKIIRSKGLFAMIGEEEKPHVFIDKSEKFRKVMKEIKELLEPCMANENCSTCEFELCVNKDIINKIKEVLGNE